jgi:hypothetical protein
VIDDQLRVIIGRVINGLVQKDYKYLEELSQGIRLKAHEIQAAVVDYGRTLTQIPISQFDNLDIIEVKNHIPQRWDLRIPLWTVEEGESDLTLELTLLKQLMEITLSKLITSTFCKNQLQSSSLPQLGR